MDADFDVVVGAVVAAFHFHDQVAAGEGAGGADGVHHPFRAGVAEADQVDRGDALGDDLGEAGLCLIRRRKRRAAREARHHRGDGGWMAVPVDERRVVIEQVDVGAAVGVLDAAPLPFRHRQRVGGMEGDGAGVAARHHPPRRGVERGGTGRDGPEIGQHVGLDLGSGANVDRRWDLHRHDDPPTVLWHEPPNWSGS